MSALTLKIIAIVAMTIDHVGALIFPQVAVLRFIGRLTMPIMAYFIGVGYNKTSNLTKYMQTLAVFAVISEIPFDLLLSGRIFSFQSQNVMVTLLIGLIAIALFDRYRYNKFSPFIVIGCAIGADMLHTDYGSWGVYLVFLLWYLGERKYGIETAIGVCTAVQFFTVFRSGVPFPMGLYPLFLLLAIPLLRLYNGQKGYTGRKPMLKYLFYLYYPLHILIIVGIHRWL